MSSSSRTSSSQHQSRPQAAPGNKWSNAAQQAQQQRQDPHGASSPYQSWTDENYRATDADMSNSEWLNNRTRKVQDDSLNTSRRALQKMRDAERLAVENTATMAGQSEQLYNVEKKLDITDRHVKSSDAKADQIKSLNKFFMLPSFGKAKKVRQREEKLKKEQEEQELRFRERNDQHLANTQQLRNFSSPSSGRGGARNYTTPNGMERCEKEQEIDGNLDEISSGLSRLKMMGQAMNTELANQTQHIDKIYGKTNVTHDRLENSNRKLNKITGGK